MRSGATGLAAGDDEEGDRGAAGPRPIAGVVGAAHGGAGQ